MTVNEEELTTLTALRSELRKVKTQRDCLVSLLRHDVYPMIEARVIRLENAYEDRAAEEWNKLQSKINTQLKGVD